MYCSTDPPGPPISPKVLDTTNCTVSLCWTEPANNGGCEILGYLIESKRADVADWTRCNVPRNLQETNYIVTGLIENTEYMFRVTAVNKVGFGEPSEVPGKYTAKDILGMYVYILVCLYKYLGKVVCYIYLRS